jgi:hypothetical protein
MIQMHESNSENINPFPLFHTTAQYYISVKYSLGSLFDMGTSYCFREKKRRQDTSNSLQIKQSSYYNWGLMGNLVLKWKTMMTEKL